MNTVSDLSWEPSMLIADGIYSIVYWHSLVVIDTKHVFQVKSNWHLQFDTNRWILLPSTAMLEDICEFIRLVVSAQKESNLAKLSDFFAKVRSPSVRVKVFLKLQCLSGLWRVKPSTTSYLYHLSSPIHSCAQNLFYHQRQVSQCNNGITISTHTILYPTWNATLPSHF